MKKEKFNIKIDVPGRAIYIDIECQDPCDAMTISGRIIECLRYVMKVEPKALIVP